ncbi:MAG: hypothetical protein ACK4IC_07035, partial [Erythrobacter sp.]
MPAPPRKGSLMRGVLAVVVLLALAGCGQIIPPGSAPPPSVPRPAAPVAANAALAGIALGPSLAALPLGEADAASALAGIQATQTHASSPSSCFRVSSVASIEAAGPASRA